MTFLSSIKRALGIDSDDFIEEEMDNGEYKVTTHDELASSTNASAPEESSVKQPLTAAAPANGSDIPGEAIEALLKVINAGVPEFIRNSIDIEIQKRQVMDAMGEPFRESIRKIKADAVAAEQQAAAQYKASAEAQIKQLNASVAEASAKYSELKTAHTSIERQKKALSERLRDLEDKKIPAYEAEKEQFQIEIKSLLNKMKVMQVKTDDVDYFKNENTRLQAELNKLRAAAVEAETDRQKITAAEEALAAADSLKARCAELEARCAEQASEIADVKAKSESDLNALKASHEAQMSDIKSQLEVSVAMVDSLRKKAAEANAKLEELKAEADNKSGADATELADIKEKLRLANSQIESLQEQLDEANSNLEIVDKIEVELDKLEKSKNEAEAKNRELESTIKENDVVTAQLRNDVEKLNATIAANDTAYSQKLKDITDRYEERIAGLQTTINNMQKPIDMESVEKAVAEAKVAVPSKAAQRRAAKRAKAVEAMDFTTAPESSPADDLFDNSIEESVSLSFDTPAAQPAAQPAVATEPVISGELSIDDELDDYWMQPTPPSKPAPEKEPEPEPVKVQPDNSMQMSLF